MPRPKTFDEDAVLDKAVELFWEGGYEATSMDKLLRELGLSRSSFYNTFGKKHDLYLAALNRYRAQSARAMQRCLESAPSVREGLQRLFARTVDEAACDAKRRGCFAANATAEMTSRDPQTAAWAAEQLRATQEAFGAALQQAQERGEVDAERDTEALARFLTNALYGLRVTSKANPSREALEDVARLTLSVLD